MELGGKLAMSHDERMKQDIAVSRGDRFDIKEELGAGGMGVVYRAYDRVRRLDVALKTMRHADGQMLYQFKHEFRALADILHPNLVTLYELQAIDSEWFFTMELVEGVSFLQFVRPYEELMPTVESSEARSPGMGEPLLGSLAAEDTQTLGLTSAIATPSPSAWATGGTDGATPRRRALEEATVDLERLRDAFAQLVEGLCALHRADKLHRDIKPSNVMVEAAGRVLVCDFGLVAEVSTQHKRKSGSGKVMGTPAYMSPEQAANLALTPASDWYSTGVMLYEALSGRLPYRRGSTPVPGKELPPAPPTPQQIDPSVPADLSELAMDLLAIDSSLRPSGSELLARLGGGSVAGLHAVPATERERVPFIGRQAQLQELRRALSDAGEGRAVAVLVSGVSGMGKSALIEGFLDDLRQKQGTLILEGRCYQRESVPYKALDTVVDAISHHLLALPDDEREPLIPDDYALLARLFPVLLSLSTPSESAAALAPDAQTLRRRAFDALHELVARIGRAQPTVVYIDDLQWGDVESADFLADLVHGGHRAPVLFLGSYRSDEAEGSVLLSKLLEPETSGRDAGDLRSITIGRLPEDEAISLALAVLGSRSAAARARAERIARDAEGNPFFVAELARLGISADAATGEEMGLDGLLAARVAQLPAEARALLTTSAVAARPISVGLLSQAAGVRDEPGALARLHAERLVRSRSAGDKDSLEPYHDRIRETIVTGLDPAEARQVHRRLARAFEAADDPDPLALVEHWLGAGHNEKACHHAVVGADRAAAALAFERAAELYSKALELATFSEDETRDLRLRLGAALIDAGRGPEAADALLEAAEGADPETRLECRRQVAEQLVISGHLERGLEAMQNLLAEIGSKMPATPKGALFSVLWQRMQLRVRGFRWKERQVDEIPSEEISRLDVYKAAGHGLGLIDSIRGADFQSRTLLLALRTGERQRVARALFSEAVFVATRGGAKSLARARELVEEGKRTAEPTQSPYLMAWGLVSEGCGCYFGSQLRLAADKLAEAEKTFSKLSGVGWELSSIRLFRMWALHRSGAFAEMAPLLTAYVRDAEHRGDIYARTTFLRSGHRVLLAMGTAEETRAELARVDWIPSEGRYHLQHWYDFDARADLALFEGCAETMLEESLVTGRGLKKSLLIRVQTVRADYFWLRARLLLAANASASGGSDAGSLREVSKLADRLDAELVGYAAVMAALVRAALLVQRQDLERAREVLEAVIQPAREQDMFLHAAIAERRLGELLGGDQGAALLATSASWMSDEGIVDPTSLAEVIAPGFGVDR